MAMEGDADRGFERLLTRLEDATRNRYCAQALDEELRDAMAKFQLCAQAMSHARQVDEATRSLVANASSVIRLDSAAVAQALSDLQTLHRTMNKSIRRMKGSVESAVREGSLTETVEEETKEAVEEDSEQVRLLEKTRSLLTKQRRSTWLADAVEMARSAVRLMNAKSEEEKTKPGDKTAFPAPDLRVYEVFKLLRKCVLKEAASSVELVPTVRKLLKRLAKKRPLMAGFVDKSDELLAAKVAKLAAKPKEEAVSSSDPPVKSKKRRLNESAAQPSHTTHAAEDVKMKIQPEQENSVSRATLDVRSKAQLCSVKTMALREGFSLAAFDVCLKMMIGVVNGLTPELTGEETAAIGSTLVSLVDKAMTIDDTKQRTDRLACLERVLGVLVRTERLEWSSSHAKATVLGYRTKCRKVLGLSGDEVTENGKPSKVPGRRKKKDKAAASSHVRFDGDE